MDISAICRAVSTIPVATTTILLAAIVVTHFMHKIGQLLLHISCSLLFHMSHSHYGNNAPWWFLFNAILWCLLFAVACPRMSMRMMPGNIFIGLVKKFDINNNQPISDKWQHSILTIIGRYWWEKNTQIFHH